MKHFLRLARDRSEAAWRVVWQRPFERAAGNRRVVEYIRIAKGRDV